MISAILCVSFGWVQASPLLVEPSFVERFRGPEYAALRFKLIEQSDREAGQAATSLNPGKSPNLQTSREVLARVVTLGVRQNVSPNERVLRALKSELDAATAYSDWHPEHFLDTAELMMAVGLGLDWLREDASPSERRRWSEGLIRLGVRPALSEIRKKSEWTERDNNWAQVCFSSLGMAGLAIREFDPKLSEEALRAARAGLAGVEAFYGSSGLSPEGADYWIYGTDFHVVFDEALRASGKSPVMSNGFKKQLESVSTVLRAPSGKSFNFADAGEDPGLSLVEAWSAGKFAEQQLIETRFWRDRFRFGALAALRLDKRSPNRTSQQHFRGPAEIGILQNDPSWLAVKGGQNGLPHGHLDLGSFVFESDGVRWFVDPGDDDYDLPGYFQGGLSGRRWSYFRTSARGHSTLFLDRKEQSPAGSAQLTVDNRVTVDLTSAFPGTKGAISRDLWLDGPRLQGRDTVANMRGGWGIRFVTKARVSAESNRVILRIASKTLLLDIRGSKKISILPGHDFPGKNNGDFTVVEVAASGNEVTWTAGPQD